MRLTAFFLATFRGLPVLVASPNGPLLFPPPFTASTYLSNPEFAQTPEPSTEFVTQSVADYASRST